MRTCGDCSQCCRVLPVWIDDKFKPSPDEYKPNLSGIVLEVLDNNPNTTKFWIDEKNFDNTNVVAKKLEQYTQRKYTKIYNGE